MATANAGDEATTTTHPPATHRDIRYGILSAQQVQLLKDRLEAELPYTLPLLRRLEFENDHPSGPDAKVFVATAVHPPSAPTSTSKSTSTDVHQHASQVTTDEDNHAWLDTWLQQQNPPSPQSSSSPWLAAHIELANQGQTQVFLYSSWANPEAGVFVSALQKEGAHRLDGSLVFGDPSTSTPTSTSSSSSSSSSASTIPTSTSIHPYLMSTLFSYIYHVLVPLLPATPSDDWLELKRTGKYLSTPYDRAKVLFGSVHESIWPYFDPSAITRTDSGYWKYVFEVPRPWSSSSLSSAATTQKQQQQQQQHPHQDQIPILPPDYRIGDLDTSHLQLALDRTPIPRTLTMLGKFVSAGIFYRDELNAPVAWGFLAKDSSISSLHTEDQHRGRGLAGHVARELLRRAVVKDEQRSNQGRDRGRGRGWGNGPATGTGTGTETDEHTRRNNSRVHHIYYYGHADVSESNVGSRSVMEKLGGVPTWKTAWTEINLRQVLEVEAAEE